MASVLWEEQRFYLVTHTWPLSKSLSVVNIETHMEKWRWTFQKQRMLTSSQSRLQIVHQILQLPHLSSYRNDRPFPDHYSFQYLSCLFLQSISGTRAGVKTNLIFQLKTFQWWDCLGKKGQNPIIIYIIVWFGLYLTLQTHLAILSTFSSLATVLSLPSPEQ